MLLSISNKEYTRANEVMDGRKFVFGESVRKLLKITQQKDAYGNR